VCCALEKTVTRRHRSRMDHSLALVRGGFDQAVEGIGGVQTVRTGCRVLRSGKNSNAQASLRDGS
jgi:hypothetical protein